MLSSVKSLLPYHKHLRRTSAGSFYTSLKLQICSASGSHELFVRGSGMCLWVRVCLYVWSLVTQPSGGNLKHLGITHSRALPGVSVSRRPGGGCVLPRPFPIWNSGIRHNTYISPWYQGVFISCSNSLYVHKWEAEPWHQEDVQVW